MSVSISYEKRELSRIAKKLSDRGIYFRDIEKAFAKEGLDVRGLSGCADLSGVRKDSYFMADIALPKSRKYKKVTEVMDVMNKRVERALTKFLSKELGVKRDIKRSEEFKKLYEVFTNYDSIRRE